MITFVDLEMMLNDPPVGFIANIESTTPKIKSIIVISPSNHPSE